MLKTTTFEMLKAVLLLAVLQTACVPDPGNACPMSSTSGGLGGAATTTSGSAQCIAGSGSACLDCMNAHCCEQYSACIAAPDKNEGVQCVSEAGCWLGTNTCPPTPLLPDTQNLAACFQVGCAGVCSPPAGSGAPGAHQPPEREPRIGTAAEALDEAGYATCSGSVFSYFRPTNFSFVTTIADDGEGLAGGWQQSATILALADGITTLYSCKVNIGMPLRTQLMGTIPSSSAAYFSALVANATAAELWPTSSPPGIFCSQFTTAMGKQFASMYPTLGARMMP